MCAACPTPRLNQSYELRPPWEQHLRYVPHRVHNGYNKPVTLTITNNRILCRLYTQLNCLDVKTCIPSCHQLNFKNICKRFCPACLSEFPVSKKICYFEYLHEGFG